MCIHWINEKGERVNWDGSVMTPEQIEEHNAHEQWWCLHCGQRVAYKDKTHVCEGVRP